LKDRAEARFEAGTAPKVGVTDLGFGALGFRKPNLGFKRPNQMAVG
jgi:hypothetical protein